MSCFSSTHNPCTEERCVCRETGYPREAELERNKGREWSSWGFPADPWFSLGNWESPSFCSGGIGTKLWCWFHTEQNFSGSLWSVENSPRHPVLPILWGTSNTSWQKDSCETALYQPSVWLSLTMSYPMWDSLWPLESESVRGCVCTLDVMGWFWRARELGIKIWVLNLFLSGS